MRPAILFAAGCSLAAWSPTFHEAQTTKAARLLPAGMARFLEDHRRDLLAGARGQHNDQVPTVEDVEEQFRRVVALSEERKRPERIARELGVLAHQVQLLTDPSAVKGVTPLRESFQAYGEEKLARLVLSREPFWAVAAPLDPRPKLLEWARTKFERHEALQAWFDEGTGRRKGGWDELSVPFAQLQLAYSNGIHATANLWIQLWRAVGDLWVPQADEIHPGR
ncbi:hypothetical protein [Mesoterricola sediminis]|uniref:hypothetical protein n=1 Tax=Mesoterricola sediminis TaxID=2927980 RepID=UPI001FAE7955|nr:hypothetical protein [Mesoterricola sediminis]